MGQLIKLIRVAIHKCNELPVIILISLKFPLTFEVIRSGYYMQVIYCIHDFQKSEHGRKIFLPGQWKSGKML